MDDGVERFTRSGAKLFADGVGDGDHRRLHDVVVRDAEQVRGLALVQEVNVVQQVPSPRARAPSMKLQTAGRIDPQCEAWSAALAPSVRPLMQGMTSTWDVSYVIGEVLR